MYLMLKMHTYMQFHTLGAYVLSLDEDIDGPAFIELSEMDIKSIVPKLGIVKKVMRLQKV